jgi:hypothetical protein
MSAKVKSTVTAAKPHVAFNEEVEENVLPTSLSTDQEPRQQPGEKAKRKARRRTRKTPAPRPAESGGVAEMPTTTSPVTAVTAQPEKPSKAATAREEDPAVEKALRNIGGELTCLNQKQRGAVLARICGAFGYEKKDSAKRQQAQKGDPSRSSTKSTERTGKERKKREPKVPNLKKSEFNEKFSETHEGQILAGTSKLFRLSTKQSRRDLMVNPLVMDLHSSLMRRRAAAKSQWEADKDNFTFVPWPVKNPDSDIAAIVAQSQVLKDLNGDDLLSNTEMSVSDISWCLLQNKFDNVPTTIQHRRATQIEADAAVKLFLVPAEVGETGSGQKRSSDATSSEQTLPALPSLKRAAPGELSRDELEEEEVAMEEEHEQLALDK